MNLLAQVGTYLGGSALPCCRLPHPLATNPVPFNRVLAQNAWRITYTAGSNHILAQKTQIDKLRFDVGGIPMPPPAHRDAPVT
ncbi:MAG: hypothetical protein Kow0063_31870 [Anaerolineae bacterium]